MGAPQQISMKFGGSLEDTSKFHILINGKISRTSV
jgi:hypothetical protein